MTESDNSSEQHDSPPMEGFRVSAASYDDGFVHISIQPPVDEIRSPCDICCVLDISGSMSDRVEIPNAKKEVYGLKKLDLVKHAMATIIHCLQCQDRLSIVVFSEGAEILFPLTTMDDPGRTFALDQLKKVRTRGSTNLWEGLKTGLETLSKDQRTVESISTLFLLTDGCASVEPPGGHLDALIQLKKTINVTCSINTFAFGYELNSKLLEDVAIEGNSGSYAFVPDGSFVGTIFINAISTVLTTAAANVRVSLPNQHLLPSDYTRWYSQSTTEADTSFDLGSITYGQTKDILVLLSVSSSPNVQLTLKYDTVHEKNKSITCNLNDIRVEAQLNLFNQHKYRLEFVHCIRMAMNTKGNIQSPSISTNQDRPQQTINVDVATLQNEMQKYADDNNKFIQDLYTDLTGQVQEALQREDWFKKWGIHFLPSLIRAHQLQYCNNFKDPGVQHYGQGRLFLAVRDDLETIFCTLPPPTAPAPPNVTQKTQPINMQVFYDAGGGCFHGDCTVRLIDGTIKLVKDVRPGDRMAPHSGTVNYVVKTKCKNQKSKMVVLDMGLMITSWHPIRLDQQWLMPCSLVSSPNEISCDVVYNFALDQGHTVFVNDVECITLGHGFQDDVVRHAYYGTQRVIEDLKQLDLEQNYSGIVEISQQILIRDQQHGQVTGLQRQAVLVQ